MDVWLDVLDLFFTYVILNHNNPVFPKFASIFGAGFFGEWRSWAYDITLQDYGYGRDFIDYCLLPFRMFSSFDLQYGFQGSLGISIGILFVLCLYHNRNIRYFLIPWFLPMGNTSPTNTIFIPAVAVVVIYGIAKIPRNKPMDVSFSVYNLVDISHTTIMEKTARI